MADPSSSSVSSAPHDTVPNEQSQEADLHATRGNHDFGDDVSVEEPSADAVDADANEPSHEDDVDATTSKHDFGHDVSAEEPGAQPPNDGTLAIVPATSQAKEVDEIPPAFSSDRNSISISFRSGLTTSSAQLSAYGATWAGAFENTMNSGFGSGAPRNKDRLRVREGREKGPWLPKIKGVGRTGKGPAKVPEMMLRALGVKRVHEDPIPETTEGLMDLERDQEWKGYPDAGPPAELDAVDTCLLMVNSRLKSELRSKGIAYDVPFNLELRTQISLSRWAIEKKDEEDMAAAWLEWRRRVQNAKVGICEMIRDDPLVAPSYGWITRTGWETDAIDANLRAIDGRLEVEQVQNGVRPGITRTGWELDAIDTNLRAIDRRLHVDQVQNGVRPGRRHPLTADLPRVIEERRQSLKTVGVHPAPAATLAQEWAEWRQIQQARILARLGRDLGVLYLEVGLSSLKNELEVMETYDRLECRETITHRHREKD